MFTLGYRAKNTKQGALTISGSYVTEDAARQAAQTFLHANNNNYDLWILRAYVKVALKSMPLVEEPVEFDYNGTPKL